MGLAKTEAYVKKVAPLGDPIELTVRGQELSLSARMQAFEVVDVHKVEGSLMAIKDYYWSCNPNCGKHPSLFDELTGPTATSAPARRYR